MLQAIRLGALAMIVLAAPATLAVAQGAAGAGEGTNGTSPTGAAGDRSTATGLSFSRNAGNGPSIGGMSPAYGGPSVTPPGNPATGASVGSPQAGTAGSGIRRNGTTAGVGINTTGTAGGACGPSFSDPTSGTSMPLTPRLSPARAMGECE